MSNEAPLVSVAIITYNQKELLIKCIESILAQDYSNIEIVIADDGSTDGTHEALLSYKQDHPGKFFLSLSEKNQGITVNSNNAHFLCKGKYIAWMGGDDLMLPGKLTRQVEFMEANENCSISYHNLEVFDSDTDKTMYYLNDKLKYSGDVRGLFKYGVVNGACSTMYKRAGTPVNGFDTRLPIASDWLYSVETLLNGGTIDYIDEVLGRYRRHPGNITSVNKINFKNEVDHLNACSILLCKVPHLNKLILYRYSEILRGLRLKDNKNFMHYSLSSFKIALNLKALMSVMAYIFSFSKIKL